MSEETYEEDSNHLSKKVDEMEIEKIQEPEDVPSFNNLEPQREYEHIEPIPSQMMQRHDIKPSQRNERVQQSHSRMGNQNNYMNSQGMNYTQSSQNPNYMLKLAKAFDDPKIPKGKLKFSQKFNFPSSSTFLEPKKV